MNVSRVGRGLGAAVVAVLIAHAGWAADSSGSRTSTGKSPSTTANRPPVSGTKAGTGRGQLPDPMLLDGSAHPAEKKSEYGMVGDFELPGDENARNGRVGGPQGQGQQQGQQPPQGGMSMGLPQAGGGGPQAQAGQPPQPAGGAGQQTPGPQNPNAAGNQIAGAGDPNAKPEGQQVAQLGGEASGNQQAGGSGERPPPVAIGDSAMRIQTPASSAAVVGSQQQAAPNTQHHEKGTGSGGKGPTAPGGTNRVEKGRSIPAGL
jgi:hypothetical protein